MIALAKTILRLSLSLMLLATGFAGVQPLHLSSHGNQQLKSAETCCQTTCTCCCSQEQNCEDSCKTSTTDKDSEHRCDCHPSGNTVSLSQALLGNMGLSAPDQKITSLLEWLAKSPSLVPVKDIDHPPAFPPVV